MAGCVACNGGAQPQRARPVVGNAHAGPSVPRSRHRKSVQRAPKSSRSRVRSGGYATHPRRPSRPPVAPPDRAAPLEVSRMPPRQARRLVLIALVGGVIADILFDRVGIGLNVTAAV